MPGDLSARERILLDTPVDGGRLLVATRRESRLRAAARAMVGIPIVVLAAMLVLLAFDDAPTVVTTQRITLRTQAGGSGTALVFGAGTGAHLVRVTDTGVPLAADLSVGELHIFSLLSLRLDASSVMGEDVRLSATGHTLRIHGNASGVGVSTGL